MSVRTRILLGCLALTLVTVSLGLYSREAGKKLGEVGLAIYDEAFMAVNYMRSAQYAFTELTARYRKALAGATSVSDVEISMEVTVILEDLGVARDRAMSTLGRDGAERLRQRLLVFGVELKTNEPATVEQSIDEIEEGFTALSERFAADGFRYRQRVEALVARSERDIWIAIAFSVLIALVITAILTRAILPSIRQALAIAFSIARGKLDNVIEPRGQSEPAQLLSALSTMQSAIVDNLANIEALRKAEAEAQAERQSAQEQINAFTEAALQASKARYALVAQGANDGLWDCDLTTHTAFYSTRWREMMALPTADEPATITLWFNQVHAEDLPGLKRQINAHLAGESDFLEAEYRVYAGSGSSRWMLCRGLCVRDAAGNAIRLAGSQTDITLRKTYERKLEVAAYEDPLTGISNRLYLLDQLEKSAMADPTIESGMIVVNLDRFRQVNSLHGAKIGDGVLIASAGRLVGMIEADEICARSGGDEFTLWMPNLSGDRVNQAKAALNEAFASPVALGRLELPIKISAGIAVAPATRPPIQLLSEARAALDRAKRLGGGRAEFYDEKLRRETEVRLRIEGEIGGAIEAGQIFMMYQPIVRVATGRIGGFEALARWSHPELGMIPPGQFIPVAEETGAIIDVGRLALVAAAAQAGEWMTGGKVAQDFTIAVNLSPRQIADRRNARDILNFLDQLGDSARHLKLEITEGVLLDDPLAMRSLLEELKARSVTLSLDDFGTGYSSLSYLHQFPFDVLKVDRSFVIGITKTVEASRLVRSIIDLGHDMGMEIVAEGVETQDQADELANLGCDFIQGYFYSRPVDVRAANGLLDRHHLDGWHAAAA